METFESILVNKKIVYEPDETKIIIIDKNDKNIPKLIGNSMWACNKCGERLFQESIQTRASDEAAVQVFRCVNIDCPLYQIPQKPLNKFTIKNI